MHEEVVGVVTDLGQRVPRAAGVCVHARAHTCACRHLMTEADTTFVSNIMQNKFFDPILRLFDLPLDTSNHRVFFSISPLQARLLLPKGATAAGIMGQVAFSKAGCGGISGSTCSSCAFVESRWDTGLRSFPWAVGGAVTQESWKDVAEQSGSACWAGILVLGPQPS